MSSAPKQIEKYGKRWAAGATHFDIELYCFRHRLCEGRVAHFKRIVAIAWPERIWHEWTETRIEGLSRYDFVSWTGHAGCGKTDDAALYAMVWWLSDPLHSTVVLTSTTGKMIRVRVWPVIQRLYWGFCANNEKYGFPKIVFPADLIDSQTCLRAQFPDGRRDHRSAIFAKAVKEGSTSRAAADIQGMHNKRILVIIDEASDTPQAIFDVLGNLIAGAEEFQVLTIANPESRLDQHGKFSEPLKGWTSIGIDDDEWETVVQLNGKPGLCQRFDAEKCPNVVNPRRELSFMPDRKQLEAARLKYTEKSPYFWKYWRGFWAPSGVCNTVMDELDVMRHGGMSRVDFISKRTPVAGLDPGFGGDDCVLSFGSLGDVAEKQGLILQIENEEVLHVDATLKEPVDYQIAHQVIERCTAYGVRPENFACDSTGSGRGVFAILFQEWSSRIKRVEFGGAASTIPAGEDDPRPANQVYDRRVTELWFSARTLLRAERLKGMSTTAVREFTMREYDTRGGRFRLQTKEEMKQKYGHSPDHADAISVLIAGVRQSGYVGTNAPTESDGGKAWRDQVARANAVYENCDYAAAN